MAMVVVRRKLKVLSQTPLEAKVQRNQKGIVYTLPSREEVPLADLIQFVIDCAALERFHKAAHDGYDGDGLAPKIHHGKLSLLGRWRGETICLHPSQKYIGWEDYLLGAHAKTHEEIFSWLENLLLHLSEGDSRLFFTRDREEALHLAYEALCRPRKNGTINRSFANRIMNLLRLTQSGAHCFQGTPLLPNTL